MIEAGIVTHVLSISFLSLAQTGTPLSRTYAAVRWRFSTGLTLCDGTPSFLLSDSGQSDSPAGSLPPSQAMYRSDTQKILQCAISWTYGARVLNVQSSVALWSLDPLWRVGGNFPCWALWQPSSLPLYLHCDVLLHHSWLIALPPTLWIISRQGSATLSQLAFHGESEPRSSWENLKWDYAVL